ncbi:uncharacterized protein E0L32_007174 [Thyridium curvatum]|uniref:TMEM205-like domain-containing protein n=1 Tax=Thyridium curvatum TaxID=1093900 RepID=A0A507B3Z6_9PEZI|nr:uncharacterized protein E0L32_007174 [Thyridium curvatum]TPX12059.1 hypothetical protein E0L32_007174 [Thyridium curvatum]
MPESSILLSPAPYHIISYGTLLGTTFFHSFVNGFVQFRVLTRPQFSAVQTKIFPIYFSMQSVIPAILILTFPGTSRTLGNLTGVAGVLDPSNRWSALAPLATMLGTGLVNLLVLLPATQRVMAARRDQEKKDGKKSWDPPPHSQEMAALNKNFGKLHGISSLLNLSNFIAALIYGVTLSARLL